MSKAGAAMVLVSDLPAPKKGVAPGRRLEGVPGELVNAAPTGVCFGGKLRTSPYDPLLDQLQRAGAGKFLKFADGLRAKPSIAARAKKLNMKVLFGEEGTTLWVTLAKANISQKGTVDEEEKTVALDQIVLDAVTAKRDTLGVIVSFMRSNGAPGIGMTQVESVMGSLARAGKIKLKKPIAGLDQERWMIA